MTYRLLKFLFGLWIFAIPLLAHEFTVKRVTFGFDQREISHAALVLIGEDERHFADPSYCENCCQTCGCTNTCFLRMQEADRRQNFGSHCLTSFNLMVASTCCGWLDFCLSPFRACCGSQEEMLLQKRFHVERLRGGNGRSRLRAWHHKKNDSTRIPADKDDDELWYDDVALDRESELTVHLVDDQGEKRLSRDGEFLVLKISGLYNRSQPRTVEFAKISSHLGVPSEVDTEIELSIRDDDTASPSAI